MGVVTFYFDYWLFLSESLIWNLLPKVWMCQEVERVMKEAGRICFQFTVYWNKPENEHKLKIMTTINKVLLSLIMTARWVWWQFQIKIWQLKHRGMAGHNKVWTLGTRVIHRIDDPQVRSGSLVQRHVVLSFCHSLIRNFIDNITLCDVMSRDAFQRRFTLMFRICFGRQNSD